MQSIGSIECDGALADLYTFNGRLEVRPTFFWRQNHEPTFSDTLRRHKRTLPLTADHLLLRGSRIKNTGNYLLMENSLLNVRINSHEFSCFFV